MYCKGRGEMLVERFCQEARASLCAGSRPAASSSIGLRPKSAQQFLRLLTPAYPDVRLDQIRHPLHDTWVAEAPLTDQPVDLLELADRRFDVAGAQLEHADCPAHVGPRREETSLADELVDLPRVVPGFGPTHGGFYDRQIGQNEAHCGFLAQCGAELGTRRRVGIGCGPIPRSKFKLANTAHDHGQDLRGGARPCQERSRQVSGDGEVLRPEEGPQRNNPDDRVDPERERGPVRIVDRVPAFS